MLKVQSLKMVGIIGTAALSIWLLAGLARADSIIVPAFTPTAYAFFPAVFRQPTVTPTPTPTRTLTPTPTQTRTPTPPAPGSLIGRLALCNPAKTSYGRLELVCVSETITNTNNFTVSYGLLGVNVIGPRSWFQISWSNYLIGPNCVGPKNGCEGSWQDNIRGPDDTAGFKNTGNYVMYLGICFSSMSSCQSFQGLWQNFLPGVPITVTN